MIDIGPYVAVYAVIIAALLNFNVTNMPNSKSWCMWYHYRRIECIIPHSLADGGDGRL